MRPNPWGTQQTMSRKRPSETKPFVQIDSPQQHYNPLRNRHMVRAEMSDGRNTTATAPSALPRITIRLKRIQAVAQWSWNANDDVCGICHAAFEGTAPGVRYPGEDSPVVWGKCGHAFHLQCVSRWLQQSTSKNLCPICRQEWEFGQNPVPNNNNSNSSENGAAAMDNDGIGNDNSNDNS